MNIKCVFKYYFQVYVKKCLDECKEFTVMLQFRKL